jgi:hypothetical protein
MSFNINTATKKQLLSIKGIGPALADRILWWQKNAGFIKLIDLMEVKGIAANVFAEAKAQGVYVMDPEEEKMTREMEDLLSLVKQLTADFILGWEFKGAPWTSTRKEKTKKLWAAYGGKKELYEMALTTAKEKFELWRKEESIRKGQEEPKLYDEDAKFLIEAEDLVNTIAVRQAYHNLGRAFVQPRLWGTELLMYEELLSHLITEEDTKEQQKLLVTKATNYYMPVEEVLHEWVCRACGTTSPSWPYMQATARKSGEALYMRAFFEAAEMRLDEAATQQSEGTARTDELEERTDGLDGEYPEHNELLEPEMEFRDEPNWIRIYWNMRRRDKYIENSKEFLRSLCHVKRSQETREYRENAARCLRAANNHLWDIFNTKKNPELRARLRSEDNALGWMTKDQLAAMSRNVVACFKVLVPHWQYAPKEIQVWSDYMRSIGQGEQAAKRMYERTEHDEIARAQHEREVEASRGDMGWTDESGDWHQTEIVFNDENYELVEMFHDAEF